MFLIFFKISFALGAIISFLVGFVILPRKSQENKKINFSFSLVSFVGALWSAGFFFLTVSESYNDAFLWRWLMDVGSILMPASWMYFVLVVLQKEKEKIRLIWILCFVTIFILFLNISDIFYRGIFVLSLGPKMIFPYYPTAGFGYWIFLLFYILVVPYSLFLLFNERKKVEGLLSEQINYILVSAIIAFSGGGMAFLPTFGILILPIGIILFSLYPLIIVYAIFRHRLFNVKIILTELVSLFLFFIFFIQLLLTTSFSQVIIKGVTLAVVCVFLYFLVRSVYKEVEQREKIEEIAKNLEIANEHLRVLDKQKSEFVSIASHQLRTPLTAIIGYSSMILEGSYGKISGKTKEAVEKVYESSRRLAIIIEDFLTISHIEQGKMAYKFEMVEIKEMMNTLIEELLPGARKKNLYLHFTTDGNGSYNVTADAGKIRQVLSNLVDNSIKYTTEGGINIHLIRDFELRKTRITIKDTGIGLSKESISALFQKFSRAKEVQKVYTDGSGIGLFIAQEIIKAHHGRIWVESDGEGKGSTFFIELLSED